MALEIIKLTIAVKFADIKHLNRMFNNNIHCNDSSRLIIYKTALLLDLHKALFRPFSTL